MSIKPNEKIAACIKEKGNWGKLDPEHKFDHKDFNAVLVQDHITIASPKLVALLENIQSLDDEDMKKHGHYFKHFIYSDIKSAYGAKLIASALASAGFQHAYGLKKTSRGMSFTIDKNLLREKTSHVFATLTSVSFFEKPIGVNFRKDLLATFNKRPENINGEEIRIIILDSGFREGVDLFDVKYVHLFEPIATKSDEKQAIGRGTRYCGQKGLRFDPQTGWPLHVYKYETILTPSIQQYLIANDVALAPADSFFQLFMKFSDIDPKKLTFANELETVAIGSAVDRDLTKKLHEFKLPGMEQAGGRSYEKLRAEILKKYGDLAWSKIEVKNMCVPSGGASILPFTPTQDFVRKYFTPEYPNPGMLLWHSVGTGKTCTAIATASSTFEKEDYTILYVTRYTLKGDVWKNMFEQACSVIIQDLLKNGATLPEAHAARLRLLSKGWFEPMSYRQFSNLLAGKNQQTKVLMERNGKKDILHKTLIIIDEAHKLFALDVEGQEKADMDVVREALMNSSRVSGKDGAKLLLMTATPYTSDPMDLIRLLNLCRPASEQLPETFDTFAEKYLNESGTFTEKTKETFYNEVAGYISYLNREKDIRSFSYPVVKNIQVPMSDYSFFESIHSLRALELNVNRSSQDISNNRALIEQDAAAMTNNLETALQGLVQPAYQRHKQCLIDVHTDKNKLITKVKMDHKKRLKDCDKMITVMKSKLREQYKNMIKQVRDGVKNKIKEKEFPKEEKDKLKVYVKQMVQRYHEDLQFDLEEIEKNESIDNCRIREGEIYALELAEVLKQPVTKESCDLLLESIKQIEKENREANHKIVQELREKGQKNLKLDQERLDILRKKYHKLSNDTHNEITTDKSQRSGLEKCLQGKVKPAYQLLLKGDSLIGNEEEEEEEIIEEEGKKKNVFLIIGHGSENVLEFNRRNKVPQDKVIVVFPVCARPNFMDTGCQFMDLFNNPKYEKILKNPIKYRSNISQLLHRPIRIYLPGEYIPDMSTNLFLDFEKETTVLSKSGVYRIQKIPEINREVLPKGTKVKEELGSPFCKQFTGVIKTPSEYNSKVHQEVYKGNLYKPAGKKDTFKNLSYRNFKLMDIMNDVGSGIYYYIGCRSSIINVQPEKYVRVLEASEVQQEERHRSKKIQSVLPLIYEVGLDEEENEVLRESPVSESSSRKSSKKEEKKEEPPKKKKKMLVNTKQEIEHLKQLIPLIYKAKEDLSSLNNLNVWRNELLQMVQTTKVKDLLKELDIIEEMDKHKDNATEELFVKTITLDSKQYFQFLHVSVVKINNRKQQFNPRIYGMIQTTMKDVPMKCSATLLKKHILALSQKKVFIDLPKTIEAASNQEVFSDLCKQVRSHY